MRPGLVALLMLLVNLLAGCGPDNATQGGGVPSVEVEETAEEAKPEQTAITGENASPETTASETTVPGAGDPDADVGGGVTLGKLPGPAVPVEADLKRTVGETATLDSGNSVTVFSGETGVPSEESVYKAREGLDFFVVEAEVCASESNAEAAYFSPREFSVLDPGAVRRRASVPTKLPALRGSSVEPGECNRGHITFQVEEEEEPQTVIFEGSSVVEWELEEN